MSESIELNSANILEVTAETNGFRGGDSGHGSRTTLKLRDLGNTDMSVIVTDGYEHTREIGLMAGSVELCLSGDCELETFIAALEWAAASLRKQALDNSKDKKYARKGLRFATEIWKADGDPGVAMEQVDKNP